MKASFTKIGEFMVGRIILAAGASTRLGRPKQLLPWRGRTLLRHAAETALADANEAPVVVVLGANAEFLRSELEELPVVIVENKEWQEGMASSLRAGIGALNSGEKAVDAALVLLCDQPLIEPVVLQSLIAMYAATGCPAIVSRYENGASGPPCLFDRSLFPRLAALTGAQGAKQVLSLLSPESIARVPFPEGAFDIDTPGDWERFVCETSL